jgi:hypothetical protein
MGRSCRLPILILAFYAAAPAIADDSCAGFTWNVQHERTLFATKPTTLDMGRDLASAPVVSPDHLYELTLIGQDQITYAIAPAKNAAPGASGGLLRIAIAESGTYRISVDQSIWIDVAANGALLTSKDYQGRPGCTAPHKIVEFDLTAGAQLTLQLSGATGSKALLSLTLAP